MANIFMMNEEIARGMVCFFHQKKHSYLIFFAANHFRILTNVTRLGETFVIWLKCGVFALGAFFPRK
jgi:hypothetical protein